MRRGWYVLGELDGGLRDKAELRLESTLEQSPCSSLRAWAEAMALRTHVSQPNQLSYWRGSGGWAIGMASGVPELQFCITRQGMWPARYCRSCPVAGVSALRGQLWERGGPASVLLRCKSSLLQKHGKEQRGRGRWPGTWGFRNHTAGRTATAEGWGGQITGQLS